MDCSLCWLPSRVSQKELCSQFNLTSSDYVRDNLNARIDRNYVRNKATQLNIISHNLSQLLSNIQKQSEFASHNLVTSFSTRHVACTRKKRMLESAQELPPAWSSLAGLGPTPFKLYKLISSDKLKVTDLGITRQLCYLTRTVIQRNFTLQLSHKIHIVNDRYRDIHPSENLLYYHPFWTKNHGSQAGISRKIRRQSVQFLCACLMGIFDLPLNHPLLQCTIQLNTVNKFRCGKCIFHKQWYRNW